MDANQQTDPTWEEIDKMEAVVKAEEEALAAKKEAAVQAEQTRLEALSKSEAATTTPEPQVEVAIRLGGMVHIFKGSASEVAQAVAEHTAAWK